MKPKKKVSNVSSLLIKKKPTKARVVRVKQDDSVLSEWDCQCEIFMWADNHKDTRLKLMYSHTNGAYTSAKTGARLKMAGAKAGIPDIFLPVPITNKNSDGSFTAYAGLFIELKKKSKGVVSPLQKQWLADLNRLGYKAVIARGAEEAITVIKNYLNIK